MVRDPKIEFSAVLLRRLHHIHQQLTELNNQLERGPRQIAAGKAVVEKAKGDVIAARETLKRARMTSDDRQLQLTMREERIEVLKTKLNAAASNREFDAFKEQIAADQQANSVLSDEILEGLEQLDVLEQQVKAAEQEAIKVESEQNARIAEIENRMVTVQTELDHITQEREKAEADIPAAARSDYDRLIAAKGEEALAPIDSDSCGGCFQTLTTQVMERLRLSQLVRCPNCNAFLYLPEDTRVT